MSAADSIRTFIAPHLTGWRIQFGRWLDGSKSDRYAIIRPVGGMPASLVRRPQFSILLVGAANDPASLPSMAAEAIIEAMRAGNGDLVVMTAGEPVYLATDDGRHTFEFPVSTITN
ncbi:MAG: hypothetical protein Q7T78_17015 [Rhodoferax sp.]|nr:hypothetical protein [Rhodoferax sp.]